MVKHVYYTTIVDDNVNNNMYFRLAGGVPVFSVFVMGQFEGKDIAVVAVSDDAEVAVVGWAHGYKPGSDPDVEEEIAEYLRTCPSVKDADLYIDPIVHDERDF